MKRSIGAKALIVPTPVWVVGTYDHEGKPNVMTAAWGGICCSKPPCVTIAVQKIRYTYNNLSELITLSVNISEKHLVLAKRFAPVKRFRVQRSGLKNPLATHMNGRSPL